MAESRRAIGGDEGQAYGETQRAAAGGRHAGPDRQRERTNEKSDEAKTNGTAEQKVSGRRV